MPAQKGLVRKNKPEAPSLVDRELSWMEFNSRILQMAENHAIPLLERLKFAVIFSSNLDEYFMVRANILYHEAEQHIRGVIAAKVQELVNRQYECMMKDILPLLSKKGAHIVSFRELDAKKQKQITHYFEKQIFPVLTPFAVDAGHPFPYLGNSRLNLIIFFKGKTKIKKGKNYASKPYAFVEVPTVVNRLIPVPGTGNNYHFILLEDLISQHISRLFFGMEVEEIIPLKVTRNQDYILHEETVIDLANSVKTELRDRSRQNVVRIEIGRNASKKLVQHLSQCLNIDEDFIHKINGPINIRDFMFLYDVPLSADLKDPPFNPRIPQVFEGQKDIFSVIRKGDVLLHHPYDSFSVVLNFINAAANDPDVLVIKQTLYRTGKNSPIAAALRRAAENGKEVTAVVELKARFDEKHNIDWALQLRESGVNTVFGFVSWKIHCKATLVIRKEGKKLRRYVHLSTGNYNTYTARIYTDIGLLSCSTSMANEVSSMFNVLTGFNSWENDDFPKSKVKSMFSQFMISPVTMHTEILRLIESEIINARAKRPARIIVKMNALSDEVIIQKLYEASCAGVKIDMIIRGICCLRPGVPGLSDNITVISIINRFLEHSRIYYFENAGKPKVYSGSADWMERSFFSRVEVCYPIMDEQIQDRIINEILATYLADNSSAWIMQADGSYVKKSPRKGEKAICSQTELINIARAAGIKSPPYELLYENLN